MAGKTAIGWTEEVWNLFFGCKMIAPECINCYAQEVAGKKLADHPFYKGLTVFNENKRRYYWNGEVGFNPALLREYVKKQKGVLVFTNSMSDPFYSEKRGEKPFGMEREWQILFFAAMLIGNQHIYQVLTKRPGNMADFINDPETMGEVFAAARRLWKEWNGKGTKASASGKPFPEERLVWPAPHIWLGTSAGCQKTADEYLPELIRIPNGWLLWVSAEPFIGRMVFKPEWLERLGWVVTGGESGDSPEDVRPMYPAWEEALEADCKRYGVAYFYKQPGNWRRLSIAEALALRAKPEQLQARIEGKRLCALVGDNRMKPEQIAEALEANPHLPLFVWSGNKHADSTNRRFPTFPDTFGRAEEIEKLFPKL